MFLVSSKSIVFISVFNSILHSQAVLETLVHEKQITLNIIMNAVFKKKRFKFAVISYVFQNGGDLVHFLVNISDYILNFLNLKEKKFITDAHFYNVNFCDLNTVKYFCKDYCLLGCDVWLVNIDVSEEPAAFIVSTKATSLVMLHHQSDPHCVLLTCMLFKLNLSKFKLSYTFKVLSHTFFRTH